MERIRFILEPHLYAEEQLMDWLFDNTENGCLLHPEEFGALWNHRDCMLDYQYDEKTTMFDAVKAIVNKLIEYIYDDEDQYFFSNLVKCVYFMGEEDRFFPEDLSVHIAPLINKYFDPDKTGVVRVQILDCIDAGRVYAEKSLRYDMRSHEGNRHKEPHVHVFDQKSHQEASIALSDQRVLGGELPRKMLKLAKKTIIEKQDYFYNCWAKKTDGLVPDINRKFGLIDY